MDPAPRMRAALLEAPGAEFRLVEVPRPHPGPGQVLVRIEASGVNPLDLKIRAGQAAHARHPLPAVLGLDLAGVVDALGDGVTGFSVGQPVYGLTGGVGGHQGSLAEYAAVDAALLAPRPAALSAREAAAMPLTFITAYEGLVDRAGVRSGESVLVIGGAGGVGQMVVQLARSRGARVFASDGAWKAATLERLGAVPIDRALPPEAVVARHTAGRGFDVVYDTAGGPALDAAFQSVRVHGRVVSALGWGTHALAPLSFRAASYAGVFTLLPLLTGEGRSHHGEILREATRLVDAGALRPAVDPRRFDLASAGAAHAAAARKDAAGKLVVDVVR